MLQQLGQRHAQSHEAVMKGVLAKSIGAGGAQARWADCRGD